MELVLKAAKGGDSPYFTSEQNCLLDYYRHNHEYMVDIFINLLFSDINDLRKLPNYDPHTWTRLSLKVSSVFSYKTWLPKYALIISLSLYMGGPLSLPSNKEINWSQSLLQESP